MLTKSKLYVAMLVLSLFLTGCAGGDATGVSVADGYAINEIRIALLIDDGNPDSGVVFEDFRQGLEEHVGMPVRVIEGATHLVGIEAMRAGNLDIMWGSPFVYLLSQQVVEVERLVVTNNPESINKTVFITNNDNIQTLEDLRGHSFAFINPSSASGFLYPVYHLMNAFDIDRDEILTGNFFSTVAYSGGQDASIMGVIHGDFDAASVGNLNLRSIIASGLINEDDIRIIDSTEIIPFPGYIAGKHLPEELRENIQQFMLSYENDEYFQTRFNAADTRFVLPEQGSILHLQSMVAALDIDLENQ